MAKIVSKGILKTWKDERGFGFIQPEIGDKDLFVHISAMNGLARRPIRGDVMYYEIAKDAGGKFKAVNVRIEGVAMTTKSKQTPLIWPILGLLAAGIAVVTYIWLMS